MINSIYIYVYIHNKIDNFIAYAYILYTGIRNIVCIDNFIVYIDNFIAYAYDKFYFNKIEFIIRAHAEEGRRSRELECKTKYTYKYRCIYNEMDGNLCKQAPQFTERKKHARENTHMYTHTCIHTHAYIHIYPPHRPPPSKHTHTHARMHTRT